MLTSIGWIEQFHATGRLGVMARPRGGEWLRDELLHKKSEGVTCIASLITDEEIQELNLTDVPTICAELEIDHLHFPIQDRSIPADPNPWIIPVLEERLFNGQRVVIHCRMGIGRTGIIAAALISRFGYDLTTAFEMVSRARGLIVPDTDEQVRWVARYIHNRRKATS